jgi:PAS domain-containing protein
MPTPPFSIVHVNKAFCTISGLSHAQVIGSPVESVIQVVQEIPRVQTQNADAMASAGLRGRFLLRPAGRRQQDPRPSSACRIRVAPITDRSQDTRGMSHVLVTVEPANTSAPGNDTGSSLSSSVRPGSVTDVMAKNTSGNNNDIHRPSSHDGVSSAHRVFGAVG